MNADERLAGLLLLWQEAQAIGRDLSPTELCRDCPELAPALAEQIRAMRHMNALAGLGKPSNTGQVAAADLTGDARSEVTSAKGVVTARNGDAAPLAFPGYKILGELGRGGMGVVYKARQIQLNRVVALKVILAGAHASAEASTRFLQEAETIARLKHPHIVQVYELGTHDGHAFFSLEYIEGGTLAARLNGEPQAPMPSAALVEKLARTMQVAHELKVVHRDLKPANILLSDDGNQESGVRGQGSGISSHSRPSSLTPDSRLLTPVPKITDFGLAKQTDSAMTASGAVLGTPSYMAPEQASGNTKEVGPAVDVYALGAILYEMLTGRPPFRGVSPWETIKMVVTAEPVPPLQLNGQVPGDLETICLKCLQKEPRRRYDSALELAEDLRRFQAGEPIEARPVGRLERAWKWARRRPAVALLTAACVLAGFALVGLGFWFSAEMGAAGAALQSKEERARDAERLAQTHEFFGLLRGIEKRNARREPGWSWANLDDLVKATALAPASEHLTELRSEAAAALGAIDLRPAGVVAEGFNAGALAFHPDGSVLALGPFNSVALLEGTVQLVEVRSRALRRTLTFRGSVTWDRDHGLVPDGIFSLAFSPDGRFLVGGARSGKLHCWDLRRETPAAISWTAHQRVIRQVRFSPDGAVLFSAGGEDDMAVKRWVCDAWGDPKSTPTCAATWKCKQEIIGLTCHSKDGWVLCGAHYGNVYFLDGETLQPIRPALADRGTHRIQFVADGGTYAAGHGPTVSVTSTRDDRVLRALSSPDDDSENVQELAFSPGGALLASVSGAAKQVKLWEMASGRLLAEVFVGTGAVTPAFAPDSRLLAFNGKGKTLLYEIGGSHTQTFCAHQPDPVLNFALHPDGRSMACQARSLVWDGFHDVTIWPCDGRPRAQPVNRLTYPATPTKALISFQPGSQLLAWFSRGALELQDSGGWGPRLAVPKVKANALCFGLDGRLWGTEENRVRVWDAKHAKQVLSWDTGWAGEISGLGTLYSVSVGERTAAVGGRDGTVHFFDAKSVGDDGRTAVRLGGGKGFKAAAWAAALRRDETEVAAGSDKGDVCVLSVPGGKVTATGTPHQKGVTALSWSAGGLLASGSQDRTVKLWRLDGGTLRELVTLPAPGPVRWLAFHPDGARLFVLLERERAVRVWHLDDLFTRLAAVGLGAGLMPIEPAPLPPPAPGIRPPLPTTVAPARPHGLKAELFRDMELRHLVKVRYDDQIDFDWGFNPADPNLQPEYISIRWTGWLQAPRPGRYTLQLQSDDGSALWLDGKRLINRWFINSGKQTVEVDLSGQPQHLRIEYFQFTRGASIHFRWAEAGGELRPVPTSALYYEKPS